MTDQDLRTGDAEFVREINRFLVLDGIRRFEPVSRTELVERTRLSRGTVSGIVGELLAEGLVKEGDPPGREGGRGRPRIQLSLNPDAAFVVGVKVSMHQIGVSVTNLRADPLAVLQLPIPPGRVGPGPVAAMLEEGVRAAVERAGLSMGQIRGVGVGLPGFIDSRSGLSHWSPILGEGPIPFAAMLQARLGPPVAIQNDANLVAMAERWFGHGQEVDDFVVVTLEAGVGMGLYLGGELRQGAHGVGSEFGHTKLSVGGGPRCRCGQSGCLEAYAGAYAIAGAARARLGLEGELEDVELDAELHRLAALARGGDGRVRAVFEAAGARLGLGVANLMNLLDPAKVIVSGTVIHAADLFVPALTAAVEENAHSGVRGRCEVVVQEWGDDVWARGAASLVLDGLYRAPAARPVARAI